MGAMLATVLAKLILRFDELISDTAASNIFRAEVRVAPFPLGRK
jgi:hypothetical protein